MFVSYLPSVVGLLRLPLGNLLLKSSTMGLAVGTFALAAALRLEENIFDVFFINKSILLLTKNVKVKIIRNILIAK